MKKNIALTIDGKIESRHDTEAEAYEEIRLHRESYEKIQKESPHLISLDNPYEYRVIQLGQTDD
ncbi:MAG: hypothetical protein GJ680_07635 [Alteromonadaceae bacterium]|nr:hypothetical protein [Alteromonadaceae bacterium]